MSEQQRESAVALFEAGYGAKVVATRLGVSPMAVRRLRDRWRLRSAGALMREPGKRSFTFEFKREVVRRFVDGEASAMELAREHDLSSPKLLENWVRVYRREGEDALRPKPKGRPGKPVDPAGLSELDRLRQENLELSAKVALLEKLRALKEQGRG
ncbi:transposase-like protein [Amycolatopsis lexingtonensis]|uniref:Transposase-like protein n=1 Tax=Amycolatopsis lexingtonensis TaxID=218822 RepID=A0ABR9I1G7_9PSEU|nr:helix-turn-helix domain-containing protein [Amycolatopsis lexingtonensis]MBE1497010.1 transposase-like protein [Amycolatopsis lexingtonensis]MBE1497489.1 transposase-like protein [Amycolatopsis lexingtonensis]MBE1501455.1 transposase-like protein [Amycolatopsis lexingtonensis]